MLDNLRWLSIMVEKEGGKNIVSILALIRDPLIETTLYKDRQNYR